MKYEAIDTETTGLKMYSPRERVKLISRCGNGSSLHGVRSKKIRKILADPKIAKLFWNAKFDIPMLKKEGYKIRGPVIDCMIMSQMTNPDEISHSLKHFARKFLDDPYLEEINLKKWQGRGKNKKPMWDAPDHIMHPYAIKDAVMTHDLFYVLRQGLKELDMVDLFKKEMKIMKVVMGMEERGLLIDQERTRSLLEVCLNELKTLRNKLCKMTGDPEFNPNSHPQVVKHVYTGEVYPTRFSRKTGEPSADRIALLSLNTDLARSIEWYRKLSKSGGTYLRNILSGLDESGIFRASFNQARAITGRFSSSGYGGQRFNLQNIPRPDPRKGVLGRIRECFIARPGYRLFFLDEDQIEIRLTAHFTQEEGMLQAIHNGEDLHNNTCHRMFHIDQSDEAWNLKRYLAKTLNFLVIYGGREQRLQETVYDQTDGELVIPLEDCSEYLERYWEAHPKLQELFDKIAEEVAENGGIRNPYGRFCPVSTSKSYVGVNYLIQGTAADFLKERMLLCADILRGKRSKMLLTIHDELGFEIHHTEKYLVKRLHEAMEDHDTFSVPLTCSVESGKRWGKKKKFQLTT